MDFVNDEIFTELQSMFSNILKIDRSEIKPESHLRDDLGVDSVDFWDIIAAFSKKFKIKISEDEAQNLATIQDVYCALKEKISARRG